MAPLAKELPGFYYDHEKNRYFPLPPSGSRNDSKRWNASSSPPDLSRPSSGSPLDRSPATIRNKRKRQHLLRHSGSSQILDSPRDSQIQGAIPIIARNSVTRMSTLHQSFNVRHRNRHALVAEQIATTSAHPDIENVPLAYPISSFAVNSSDPRVQILGTDDGSIWSGWNNRPVDTLHALPAPRDFVPYESFWRSEFGLMSKITSTAIDNGRFFATSFGPHAKVLICKLPDSPFHNGDVLEEQIRTYPWDIWTGSFTGNGFVLGMSQRILIVPDIDAHQSRCCKTHTDIISLAQHDNLIYAGGRNGSVFQYDKRTLYQPSADILKARTSVTNIKPLRSWELLVTAINGDMKIYDLRALRNPKNSICDPPCVVQLHGHYSSLSLALPVAVDPSHDFVFAAGEDSVIRAWSTRTGQRLQPPPSESNLIDKQFQEHIVDMHISDSLSDPSPSLWVAHGKTIKRWYLGRHDAAQ